VLNDVGSALVVLVIKRTDTLSFVEFHATYETLVEKGRTNTLLADRCSREPRPWPRKARPTFQLPSHTPRAGPP